MKPIIQSWRSYFRSRRPTWFAGAFVAFSCAWIWVTDGLVRHFGLSAAEPSPWNAARRLVYVAITGGLIYKILRRLEEANNNLEQTVTTRTAALTASEEELRTREEWLRRLLASLPDVSWTTSEDMRTVFVSPNVEEIFGFFCGGGLREHRKGVSGVHSSRGQAAGHRRFPGALHRGANASMRNSAPSAKMASGSGCMTGRFGRTAKKA